MVAVIHTYNTPSLPCEIHTFALEGLCQHEPIF